MLKTSVISTVYNGEKFFDKAIPHILSQELKDFEYVIVDDGSTDNTWKLLQEVAKKDSRVRIFSPGRLGRAKALNFAVSQAKGIYIANQDFDDTSRPNRLEKQEQFLNDHPEVGVVGSYYEIVDENRGEKFIRQQPCTHIELVKSLSRTIPFANTLVTFRKEAWEMVGGYPDMEDVEDLRMWILFTKNGWKLANLPDILGSHWVYKDSYWHKNFSYANRQYRQAKVHFSAIKDLKMPLWHAIYPLGRLIYPIIPNRLKKIIRRSIGLSKETDTN